MAKFFDSENPVMRFLARLVDLALLNVVTLVYSLPLITAGGALTAMNYVLLHLYRRDETYVTRMFRKSFRDNLKQGIPLGLIVLFTAVITATDLWAMHASGSRMMTLMMIIITVIAGFLFVTFVYMFALQSRYENTVKGTIVNAFRLALANLPRTVVMMIIWIIWILVMVYLHRAALLAFLLYGFSLPGYLCTMLYEPVFVRLEEE
jgi:uncharacterized membrane protein YesL